MVAGKLPLPDFRNPPVMEVLAGVTFEPLVGFHAAHFGLLWSKFRDRFPKTEEHAPLEPAFETFGQRDPMRGKLQVQMVENPPLPRCWFLTQDGERLLQVQQDRFIHNWRKVGTGAAYPRFEQIRGTFKSEFEEFVSFVSTEKLGDLHVIQCEVTYVNHIIAGEGWDTFADVANVFRVWNRAEPNSFIGNPEQLQFAVPYAIPNNEGVPVGRLHIEVTPAFRNADRRSLFRVSLTARGLPLGEGVDGVLNFFEVGREWIVRGFAEVTTPHMHRIWERLDV